MRALLILLLTLFALLSLPAGADAGVRSAKTPYVEGPASRDGIGRTYHGREIARVMGFEGSAWLERAERQQEERPDLLVDSLQLHPDWTVADVGAGSGYLTRRIAARLHKGQVFAVDVQPEMVRMLQALAQERGFANVIPRQATPDDPGLPAESVDLAVLVDVYHELQSPAEVIGHLVTALKPGGRLVLVEYRGEDPAVPIKPLHKMTEAQVRLELADFPLDWERTDERLPIQHVLVFRKRSGIRRP